MLFYAKTTIIFFVIFILKQILLRIGDNEEYVNFYQIWLLAPLTSILLLIPSLKGNVVNLKKNKIINISIIEVFLFLCLNLTILIIYSSIELLTLLILVMRTYMTEYFILIGNKKNVLKIDLILCFFWVFTLLTILFIPSCLNLFLGLFTTLMGILLFRILRKKIFKLTFFPNKSAWSYTLSVAFVPAIAFFYSTQLSKNVVANFLSLYLIANAIITLFSLLFDRYVYSTRKKPTGLKRYLLHQSYLNIVILTVIYISSSFKIQNAYVIIIFFTIIRALYGVNIGLIINQFIPLKTQHFIMMTIMMYTIAWINYLCCNNTFLDFFKNVLTSQAIFALGIYILSKRYLTNC